MTTTPRTWTACCLQQAFAILQSSASDGDTIRLHWTGASAHAKLAIESAALGRGIDIKVELTK